MSLAPITLQVFCAVHPPNIADIRNRVLNSPAARKFAGTKHSDFPETDVEHALMIDRFDFAMKVARRDNLLVLRPVQ